MRKQDIKPGVVYAYRRGRSDYDEPKPAMFLAAPMAGVLYKEPRRYGSTAPDRPVFIRDHTATKPYSASSYTGASVGYPVVRLRWNAPTATPDDLLKVTLADFESATSAYRDDGVEFAILTSLTGVMGLYVEEKAAHDARREAENEKADRERRAADASRARAERVIAALRAHGITPDDLLPYRDARSISLPLDEAEKLIALLGAKSGNEG